MRKTSAVWLKRKDMTINNPMKNPTRIQDSQQQENFLPPRLPPPTSSQQRRNFLPPRLPSPTSPQQRRSSPRRNDPSLSSTHNTNAAPPHVYPRLPSPTRSQPDRHGVQSTSSRRDVPPATLNNSTTHPGGRPRKRCYIEVIGSSSESPPHQPTSDAHPTGQQRQEAGEEPLSSLICPICCDTMIDITATSYPLW